MKITKYALAVALSVVALAAPRTVRADTVTFDASGIFADGAVLSGTVTIDTTLGTVVATALSLSGPVATGPLGLGTPQGGYPQTSPTAYEFNVGSPFFTATQFDMFLATPTLTGYLGGAFCGTSNASSACPASTFSTVEGGPSSTLVSGALSLPAAAPEPSTLALLGTGLLAFVGIKLTRKKAETTVV